MRFKIYIDGYEQDSTDSLDDAKGIYASLCDTAKDSNYPVRIELKDLRSFEILETYSPYI